MTELYAFSDALVAAYHSGTRVAPEGPLPQGAADAYVVQTALVAALGPVAGFKVGFLPDGTPIMAPIPAVNTVASGAKIAVADKMGIELEVGWKVIGPVPAPGAPDFEAALIRAVMPVPVIELCDTRVTGADADDPWVKLADLQVNHGLVVGAPLATWDGSDFGTVTAHLSAGDEGLLDGTAGVPGGSALSTLAAFVRVVGDHCGGLQVGQVVITGSLHPPAYRPAGIDVAGQIDGLGEVSVTFG